MSTFANSGRSLKSQSAKMLPTETNISKQQHLTKIPSMFRATGLKPPHFNHVPILLWHILSSIGQPPPSTAAPAWEANKKLHQFVLRRRRQHHRRRLHRGRQGRQARRRGAHQAYNKHKDEDDGDGDGEECVRSWSPWSPCSVSCGQGTEKRIRRAGQEQCAGEQQEQEEESRSCYRGKCP